VVAVGGSYRLDQLLTTARKAIEAEMTDAVHEQCAALAPLEQFWAFPGHVAFAVVQELAAAGGWERLGRLVARINRALVTESYRTGSLDSIAHAEHRADDDDIVFGVSQDQFTRPYFEVANTSRPTMSRNGWNPANQSSRRPS
jgi:arginine decarboxylase